ncbi:17.5 kDa class I heat shock protein [Pelomyxa schiedti]|nr:17.5 kDa class I heat shock protein [Pelomyxa schiedti]
MEQSDGSKVEGQPAKGNKKEESTSTTATEPVNSEGSSSTSAAAKDVSAVTVPKASSAAVSEPNRGGFWRMSNWDMWWPKSDVKETETNIQVIAELPGVKKEDVKVEVTPDGFLVISGNKNHTKEETAEQGTWHTTERSFGQFTRRFRLPKGVESSQITGAFENGTLTVTVPKPPVPPQPESHKVEIH